MITENLSALKIHRLTQEQYDRELAAGTLEENALYLTPDEENDLSLYATIEQLNTKADAIHSHQISEITDFPTSMPANGGNADTLGGKSANEFASVSDIDDIKELIGDEKVSDQIDAAMQESVADWDQNNSTAKNYIKNRPFYDKPVDILFDDNITLKFNPMGTGESIAGIKLSKMLTVDTKYFITIDNETVVGVCKSNNNNDIVQITINDGFSFGGPVSIFVNSGDYNNALMHAYVNYQDKACYLHIEEESVLRKLDLKYLPIATDEEIIDLLIQENMLPAITDSDGSILSDENGNILSW